MPRRRKAAFAVGVLRKGSRYAESLTSQAANRLPLAGSESEPPSPLDDLAFSRDSNGCCGTTRARGSPLFCGAAPAPEVC
jgi:hypothetical protein